MILSITILICLLVILAVIFVVFFLELVFPGHDNGFYDLIRMQFYIAVPCLFFWGYISFLGGMLELENKFLLSTLSRFITPITIILCLFYLKPIVGDTVLVLALTLGSFLTFVYYLLINLKYKTIELNKLTINNNMF